MNAAMFWKYFAWFCLIVTIVACTEQCRNSAFTYEQYLGTKTPYRVVANKTANEVKYDGCEAKKLWALVRHGTRNPNVKLIEKMRTRLSEIRDEILENLPEATDQGPYSRVHPIGPICDGTNLFLSRDFLLTLKNRILE